jgi:hypothetical protein
LQLGVAGGQHHRAQGFVTELQGNKEGLALSSM